MIYGEQCLSRVVFSFKVICSLDDGNSYFISLIWGKINTIHMTGMISGILYAAVFLSSLVDFEEVSAFTFCEASVNTIKYVKECPTNVEEWNIAARNKNSDSI